LQANPLRWDFVRLQAGSYSHCLSLRDSSGPASIDGKIINKGFLKINGWFIRPFFN